MQYPVQFYGPWGQHPATYEVRLHGTAGHPRSYAWLCVVCGSVWARMGDSGQWEPQRSVCGECELPLAQRSAITWSLVPGSILCGWDRDLERALPRAILEWEFERHLSWFEWKEKR